MSTKKIATPLAPPAQGPYSQAIDTGETLYVCGVMPLDAQTGALAGESIEAQTTAIMENLKAICEAAGYNLDNVVKTTCFLSDIADFGRFNEIYARYLTCAPARSCVAVKEIPKGAKAQVDAIAYKPKKA